MSEEKKLSGAEIKALFSGTSYKKFFVDDDVMASYRDRGGRPLYNYHNEAQISAAWQLDDIKDTHLFYLYAAIAVGAGNYNLIEDYIKRWRNDLARAKDYSVEIPDGSASKAMLTDLFKNGLLMRYGYRSGAGDNNLYVVPREGLNVCASLLKKNVKVMDFFAVRPLYELLGTAAGSFVGLKLAELPTYKSMTVVPYYKSKDLGRVQYSMEVVHEVNNTKYITAVVPLYFYRDARLVSLEDHLISIDNKVAFVNEFLKKRVVKNADNTVARVVCVCNDWHDIELFVDRMSSHSDWHTNTGNILFASEACFRRYSEDFVESMLYVPEYVAKNVTDEETGDVKTVYAAKGIAPVKPKGTFI